MGAPLTMKQQAVSEFLAQNPVVFPRNPRTQLAFLKGALLSLRGHGVPVTLAARPVGVSPWSKSSPRKIYALVVEGRPIGITGLIGWKSIAQDCCPAGSVLIYTSSARKASHLDPSRFKIDDDDEVRAHLAAVDCGFSATLMRHSTPTPTHQAAPTRF